MTTSCRVFIFWLASVWLLPSTAGAMSDGGSADRKLWELKVSFLAKLNDPYQKTRERLVERCGSYRPSCFRKHHRPRTIRLGTVFSRPDSASRPRGTLGADLRFSGERGLHYILVFLPRSPSDTVPRTWRGPLDNWGYGESFVVTRRRGSWVRFPRIAGGRPGWVHVRAGPLTGHLSGVVEQVWDLEGTVDARNVATGRSRTVKGSIYISRVDGGLVYFRPEVPSDMACGREVIDPDTVPRYRAPVGVFLDPRGVPRLKDAYPRGC